MFSGIVEEMGVVKTFDRDFGEAHLSILSETYEASLKRMETRMPITAMTASISMRVNPDEIPCPNLREPAFPMGVKS